MFRRMIVMISVTYSQDIVNIRLLTGSEAPSLIHEHSILNIGPISYKPEVGHAFTE